MFSNHVEQVIKRCNIHVKSSSHKRCIELFNPFMSRFEENPNTLKSVCEFILKRKLTTNYRETGCFNGRYDHDILRAPFKVHLYIQYDAVRINLNYIKNEDDLKEAFSYQEEVEDEFKVLIVHSSMEKYITKEIQNKTLIVKEAVIDQLSNMRSDIGDI